MPEGTKIRVRGVYGKPWSKMAGTKIPIDRQILQRLGKAMVTAVVEEAKVDFAKQGRSPTPKGQAEGIPDSDNFFESFDYKIVGKSTIVITSTWPWMEEVIEGRPPYKMTWLTRSQRVYKVPFPQRDGTVLIRTAPLKMADAWIHPGFARHTFLERGVRRARKEMAKIVAEEAKKMLRKGNPLA